MQSSNPADWVTYAERDHQAMLLLLSERERFAPQVLFFAQQSAEKYMKAVLVSHKCEPPFTHDLLKLIRELEPRHPEATTLAQCSSRLNNDYIYSRYPVGASSHPDVEQAVEDCKQVRAFCRNLLEPYL